MKRRVFLGAGTAATVVAMDALLNPRQSLAQSKAINVYSSRHYNTDQRLYNNFTAQTGIKVNLIEGKDDLLIERIKQEGSRSPADVLITVDAGRLWRATQAGIYAPVNSAVLNKAIPKYLRDSQNRWFGFSKRLRVIMYNKNQVSKSQLTGYGDLAAPKWKGKVVIRSSENVYNQSFVAWLMVTQGTAAAEQWCRGVVNNFARRPQGGDTDQIKAVAAGIGSLGLANTYYLARLGASKDPSDQSVFKKVGVYFPDQKGRGVHVNISGGGLVKTAPNKAGAIKFLEYLVSPSAQQFFAQGNFEYPVISGVTLDPILQSFGSFKSDVASVDDYGPNLARAAQIMAKAGWK
ncbi:MAG: Fe(3+) ABC transporter substrate-binding protein [Synechocystis sp.]|nr:Fe(3+) ABC transporter substrate-binding protein [Synechocystis sp.]